MKKCNTCEIEKPDVDFYAQRRNGRLFNMCKKCVIARSAAYQKLRDPVLLRDSYLRHTYDISFGDYEAMLEQQNGVCAICLKEDPRGIRLSVDHDHSSGKVRGLLCTKCNHMVGKSKEKLDMLKRAVEYLERT